MKIRSITRVGSGGRIVIPKDIRSLLELREDDFLEVTADDSGVVSLHRVSAYIPNVKVAMTDDSRKMPARYDMKKVITGIHVGLVSRGNEMRAEELLDQQEALSNVGGVRSMGKAIAIWGAPGSGKTSLSVVLAKLLSKNNNVLILNSDICVPVISLVLPSIDSNGSIGKVLNASSITEDIVAQNINLCPKNDRIGVLGMGFDKNCLTYQPFDRSSCEKLFSVAKSLCDFLIIDCVSLLTADMLSVIALEQVDKVIRVSCIDNKSEIFMRAQMPVLVEDIFHPERHIRVVNKVVDGQPVEGEFDYVLLYNQETKNKFMAGKLFEDYYTKDG
jgi:AbrB family looped-hinge helix DNA binding protein